MSFFFVFVYLSIIIIKCESNIIIQFKIIENTENTFISNLIFNTYYSKIEIGSPSQVIEAQISSKKSGIILKENSCLSPFYYNKKYSTSIIEKSHCEYNNIYDFYKEISINETITFPNYNSNYKCNIKNFPLLYFKQLSDYEIQIIKKYGRKMELYDSLYDEFLNINNNNSLLENNKDGKACLLIGMSIRPSYNCLSNTNLISFLNKNNIIKHSNWEIKYYNENEKGKNEYDGELIIGEFPHELSPQKYNKEQFYMTDTLYYNNEQFWQIYFNEVYFFISDNENGGNKQVNDNKINVALKSYAQFDFDVRVIFGPKKYKELINEHFFSKYPDKCEYNRTNYGMFICDKNLIVNKFPSLYFYHKIYNYTFELNYEDLFKDINDKKYFLIVFDEDEPDIWKFGTLFLRKYLFVFNTEEKTIGFYNDKIKINSNTYETRIYFFLLMIIVVIFSAIGGFLLGKKIYQKIRHKRRNELSDSDNYYNIND